MALRPLSRDGRLDGVVCGYLFGSARTSSRACLNSLATNSAAAIKRQQIAGRDRRADTPAQSRNFLDAMRGIFRWAADAVHVKIDPTLGVKNPARPKGGGFPVWTEDDVARYEARWRVGTKERVWLDVLAYTGLRRGGRRPGSGASTRTRVHMRCRWATAYQGVVR